MLEFEISNPTLDRNSSFLLTDPQTSVHLLPHFMASPLLLDNDGCLCSGQQWFKQEGVGLWGVSLHQPFLEYYILFFCQNQQLLKGEKRLDVETVFLFEDLQLGVSDEAFLRVYLQFFCHRPQLQLLHPSPLPLRHDSFDYSDAVVVGEKKQKVLLVFQLGQRDVAEVVHNFIFFNLLKVDSVESAVLPGEVDFAC